jgi:hypothetical protein
MLDCKKILIIFLFIAGLLKAQIYSDKDLEICNSKFNFAINEKLANKPIGDVIVEVGKSFLGTEYAAHTIEKGDSETLVINLTGLDCTTFLENSLVLARCIKENKTSFDNYKTELTKIRYRDGIINKYPSRLHYFSDWIFNNVKKGIVKDISGDIGGIPLKFKLDFMTTHPDSYVRLTKDPEFIPIIRKQEEEINQREYYFIPKEKIASIENKIINGDLIAITSSIKGLDINHVGIAVKMEDGRIHFMHAPNVGYKVQITEIPLSDYLLKIKKDTGIIVLKAINP